MNRKIIFRGRRKNGKEILTGDLNHIEGKVYIFPRTEEDFPGKFNSPDWFEVDPDTVGQEWISAKDELPEIPNEKWKSVTVLCSWGVRKEGNVATLQFTCDEVKGKLVKRFKYHGRNDPFGVTHWLPLDQFFESPELLTK